MRFYRVEGGFEQVVGDDDHELRLWWKRDHIGSQPAGGLRRVAASSNIDDGEAADANISKRNLDRLQPIGTYECGDLDQMLKVLQW